MSNVAAQPALALILFAPWFLILATLYWCYPRQPRDARRRLFDVAALALAFIGCLLSLHWSFGVADRSYGQLWPQILATSVGYGVFLAVLGGAFWLRRKLLVAR
ncbi:MAG: hypothetical protein QM612_11200 [Thermomonas sp.]|uniref:hypothetical protein n=1 Tax=Thermomonas sp. TaxID=1971895 RepID=UPI0039E5C36D